ncbi:MAG: Holliday junction resolvase RuvX [Verrucomicrobiota bacterium]
MTNGAPSQEVRALGIDHGTVRIGVAKSDDIGLLAHPVETIDAKDSSVAVARIIELVETFGISDLVFGIPYRENGEAGSAAARVSEFIEKVRQRLPEGVACHEVDEAWTTQDAMAKLHQAGRTEKNSRGIIDQAAAVEILQRWLDCRVPMDQVT